MPMECRGRNHFQVRIIKLDRDDEKIISRKKKKTDKAVINGWDTNPINFPEYHEALKKNPHQLKEVEHDN